MAIDRGKLKQKAFSGTAWKLSERVVAQLASMIVSIVLARLLLPEDYSVVSIVSIYSAICNVLITGGFNTALIQKKDADALDCSTVLCITEIVSVFMYIVMFFCAPVIAEIYEKPILVPVTRVMCVSFFLLSFKSVLVAYTASMLDFKKTFIAEIASAGISAAVGIAMAAHGAGTWALVAQYLTHSAANIVILTIVTRFKVMLRISWTRFKSLFSYGWKIFAASIVSVIYDECCPLIVGVKFSANDLAYYNKGKSFPNLLNSSIKDTLASVLFPIISKVQDDREAVLNITRRYMRTASYVIFPMMVGFWAVSDSFVITVLTEKWLGIVPYIQIFCLSYMFDVIQIGNLQAIRAVGRSDIVLILEIIKKVIYFAIIAIFVFLSHNAQALALSSVLCAIVACIANSWPNRKLINYKYYYQIRDVLPNFVLSILMGVIVFFVGKLALPSALLLVLQILVGFCTYVLLSAITKNQNFKYLLDFVKKMTTKENKSADKM